MKINNRRKYIFLLCLIIISINLTSAFKVDIPQPSGNITYQNNTYINQTVNATVNTTQFDSNNPIHIKESWLNTFINSVVDLSDSNIKPSTTNLYSLGNSTLRWLKGWFSELDISGNINQTSGNATINNNYGEMYCKNDTGCGVIDLVTQDVYVAMRNQTAGSLNGFSLNGGTNLTAQVSGLYQVNAKASISAGTPAGDFGMKLFLNDTGQNNCYDNFKVGNDHISMVITCLVRINAGQNVSIRFDDHNSPVTDITLYTSNLNLVRIGN